MRVLSERRGQPSVSSRASLSAPAPPTTHHKCMYSSRGPVCRVMPAQVHEGCHEATLHSVLEFEGAPPCPLPRSATNVRASGAISVTASATISQPVFPAQNCCDGQLSRAAPSVAAPRRFTMPANESIVTIAMGIEMGECRCPKPPAVAISLQSGRRKLVRPAGLEPATSWFVGQCRCLDSRVLRVCSSDRNTLNA